MKSCEEINGLMELLFGKKLVNQNDCFGNAMRILQIDPRMSYCEGVVDGRTLSLRHAWNAFDGEEFDLTAETFMPDSMRKNRIYHKEFETNEYHLVVRYRNTHIDKIDILKRKAYNGEELSDDEKDFIAQNI